MNKNELLQYAQAAAIESLNSVIRKAFKRRKMLPTVASAKNVTYLAIHSVSKNRQCQSEIRN